MAGTMLISAPTLGQATGQRGSPQAQRTTELWRHNYGSLLTRVALSRQRHVHVCKAAVLDVPGPSKRAGIALASTPSPSPSPPPSLPAFLASFHPAAPRLADSLTPSHRAAATRLSEDHDDDSSDDEAPPSPHPARALPALVLPWEGFEQTCAAFVAASASESESDTSPESSRDSAGAAWACPGPGDGAADAGAAAAGGSGAAGPVVGSEAELRAALLAGVLQPLRRAAAAAGVAAVHVGTVGPCERDVAGLVGCPDLLISDAAASRLLLPLEVKTSRDFWVEGGDLAAAYNAPGGPGEGPLASAVAQLYLYGAQVPYAVLLTDRQMFVAHREGTTLRVSRAIPLASSPAPSSSSSAPSVTAVGALFFAASLAAAWWEAPALSPQRCPSSATPSSATPSSPYTPTSTSAASAPGPDPLHGGCCLTTEELFGPGAGADPRFVPGAPGAPGGPGAGPGSFVAAGRCGVVRRGVVAGAPAAVKVVDLFNEPGALKEVQREVRYYRRLAPLQGTAIPRLLGHGFTDGGAQYYMATSLEGASLDSPRWAAAGGWPLPRPQVAAQALAALRAVQGAGVLHGDVAPRNFVFSAEQDGAPPRVLLLDFGFAQRSSRLGWTGGELAVACLAEAEREQLLLDLDALAPAAAAAAAGGLAGTAAAVAGRASADGPEAPEPEAVIAPVPEVDGGLDAMAFVPPPLAVPYVPEAPAFVEGHAPLWGAPEGEQRQTERVQGAERERPVEHAFLRSRAAAAKAPAPTLGAPAPAPCPVASALASVDLLLQTAREERKAAGALVSASAPAPAPEPEPAHAEVTAPQAQAQAQAQPEPESAGGTKYVEWWDDGFVAVQA
ncbi:hypothetical protein HYH03_008640 [Edaphochlamys debaryana]|uniref:Protein kinase domain-containing protein n=1 Tax=Edaphochlamys debaryana TaxID=47281 RepID=A0A836BZC3_9CHLO|nr:hypothetical protein HYH03_008640 [Edaphochlamys debaryana]|eukprot:KAG2493224.1 hypothetical protein HYH03_008640 [Edaphochlamys debaryana]